MDRPHLLDRTAAGPPVLRRRPVARGLLVGVATAAATFLVVGTHALPSWSSLLVVTAVGLAIPTSRLMSRRLLLAGAVVLGWTQVLWWWQVPVGGAGRTTVVVATIAGALAGWVAGGHDVRRRAARLVPRLRGVDAVVAVSGLAAVVAALPWLCASTGEQSLALLSRGWDHAAHYWLTATLRDGGVALWSQPLPVDGTWANAPYPTGAHTVIASLMEVMTGPAPRSDAVELTTYAHALGLCVVGATVLLAAAVCSVPRLVRRPALAAPLVTVVVSVLLLGAGARILTDGFPNFLLAAALLGCAPALVVGLQRIVRPLWLLALGGVVVGLAHDWGLLLSMAGVAVLVVVLPLARRRWQASPRSWVAGGAIGVATAAMVLRAVDQLSNGGLSSGGGVDLGLGTLARPGPITAPPVVSVVALGAGALAACVAVGARLARQPSRSGGDVRAAASGVAVLVGSVMTWALAQLTLRVTGEIGYYAWKFALGLMVLSAVVLATATAAALPAGAATRSRRRTVTLSALGVGLVVALAGTSVLTRWPPTGVQAWRELTAYAAQPPPAAVRVLAATYADLPEGTAGSVHPVLLPLPDEGGLDMQQAAQWYLALTRTWTVAAHTTVLDHLYSDDPHPSDPGAWATEVLRDDARAVVVVDPAWVDSVRAGVVSRGEEAARVLTW